MRQAIYDIGIFPTIDFSSEQVRAFTSADVLELQDELGAGDRMLEALRVLASVPGRRMRLDFEHQVVTPI